ncbi:hypothetical protein H1R20_g3769, partial [Candolleomyces eurysporus]
MNGPQSGAKSLSEVRPQRHGKKASIPSRNRFKAWPPTSQGYPDIGNCTMLAVFSVLVAYAVQRALTAPSPSALGSDLTFLFQNDLNWQTAGDHHGAILLSTPVSNADAIKACAGINETLLPTDGVYFRDDIKNLLNYAAQTQSTSKERLLWVKTPSDTSEGCSAISVEGKIQKARCSSRLQPLCSQSAPYRRNTATDPNPAYQVQVKSKALTIVGTRDHLSFRFLGIPYASPFQRFSYSQVYNGTGTISALQYGPACVQRSFGTEDCLSLNIYTPYLPQSSSDRSNRNLRPVMFWIHGGGFTDGVSSDSDFDGGNLASRGDVVVVNINYRLGTLGFLALKDGVTNGNFGIADQITALQWVQQHIADFGGDPNRVTIFGQSAGAGSVRALLAAKPAFGLFKAAIAQSNLGGFGYAKTYSKYMPIEEEYTNYAQSVISAVGCADRDDTLACLREAPALALTNAPNAPRYIVVDGKYITTDELKVDGSGPAARAHVMFGWTRDDGSDFIGAWPGPETTALEILTRSGLSTEIASKALSSDLFPLSASGPNTTWNLFNQTSRIATVGQFSCIDQATVIAAAKHRVFPFIYAYQFDRTYVGWEPIAGTCGPASTAEFPHGDLKLPYFRCHSGELSYMFGTLGQRSLPFRDWDDLVMTQVSVDMWTAFARTYDPNPSSAFLNARGYTNTTVALRKGGRVGGGGTV